MIDQVALGCECWSLNYGHCEVSLDMSMGTASRDEWFSRRFSDGKISYYQP